MRSQIHDQHGPFIQDVIRYLQTECTLFPERVRPIVAYHYKGLPHTKGFRIALFKTLYDINMQRGGPIIDYNKIIQRAAYIHMIHEVSLILDDIFDKDDKRRGQRTVHCMYGTVPAASVAGWLTAYGLKHFSDDSILVRAIADCCTQLAEAEILQWQARLNPRPTDFETWKEIARGDTGALFRLAADFAGCSNTDYVREIQALTYLYHGLDDVQDMTEDAAPDDSFVGGRKADLRDEIPTLLTCFTDSKKESELKRVAPQAIKYLQQFQKVPHHHRLDVFFNVLSV